MIAGHMMLTAELKATIEAEPLETTGEFARELRIAQRSFGVVLDRNKSSTDGCFMSLTKNEKIMY